MSPRNAWALLIAASGEDSNLSVDAHTRWRIRQTLAQNSLAALDGRVSRRATAHHLWALPGELRRLHDDDALVMTGSSAAGALGLDLAAPNTIDAYVIDEHLRELIREHALDGVPSSRANVVLRAVPTMRGCSPSAGARQLQRSDSTSRGIRTPDPPASAKNY